MEYPVVGQSKRVHYPVFAFRVNHRRRAESGHNAAKGGGVEWHLLKPTRVVSGGNVGARDGAVEPTGTYSRRFPEEITRIGLSKCRS